MMLYRALSRSGHSFYFWWCMHTFFVVAHVALSAVRPSTLLRPSVVKVGVCAYRVKRGILCFVFPALAQGSSVSVFGD